MSGIHLMHRYFFRPFVLIWVGVCLACLVFLNYHYVGLPLWVSVMAATAFTAAALVANITFVFTFAHRRSAAISIAWAGLFVVVAAALTSVICLLAGQPITMIMRAVMFISPVAAFLMCNIILILTFSGKAGSNADGVGASQQITDRSPQSPGAVSGGNIKTGNVLDAQLDSGSQVMDKISIKSSSGIMILDIGDILYIQAYGDYAIINTTAEKFVKENTMKDLENNLPSNFVRVHRSFIVNSDYLSRIEAHGKETYSLHLKNSVTVRASAAGYRLLKQKLNI